jgi:hypothetical protein
MPLGCTAPLPRCAGCCSRYCIATTNPTHCALCWGPNRFCRPGLTWLRLQRATLLHQSCCQPSGRCPHAYAHVDSPACNAIYYRLQAALQRCCCPLWHTMARRTGTPTGGPGTSSRCQACCCDSQLQVTAVAP